MLRYEEIPEHRLPESRAARRFLDEQWNSGLFEVIAQPDGAYAAVFRDDGEVIPLADMAYNRDIGLFRPSQFPDQPDEC